MKRILSVLLLIVLVLSFAGCKGGSSGGEGHIGNKDSAFDENASENITLDHAAGNLSMDESVVKELLSAFSLQDLGLAQSVYDYVFSIKQATLNGKACVEAKAYLADPKKVEGTFYITGTECYRFDEATGEYYLLTTKGSQRAEVTIEGTNPADDTTQGVTESTTQQRTQDDINDENTQVLRARYKNYDLSVVGVPKPIENYTFLATGKTAKAADGEKVYIIYLLENGQYTDFTFAMSLSGKDYYYDSANDEYKALK